jgi:hypothetical protein
MNRKEKKKTQSKKEVSVYVSRMEGKRDKLARGGRIIYPTNDD